MAANFITQSSLVQPKPSLSAKTPQNPSLSRLSKLSPSSSVCFLLKKRTGSVRKISLASAVSDSTSSILENKKNSKNPIIVIDNYDSFTYNLCQYMGELGCHFECIGEAFGGKIVRSPYGVMHGKSSLVYYDEKGEDGLFTGLPNPFNAGRYHSLVIEKDSFPGEALEVTAWMEDGLIMGARHKVYKHLQGVQFHPESIITSEGKTIVRNFIKLIERKEASESRNSSS